jgi:hypothetical protein
MFRMLCLFHFESGKGGKKSDNSTMEMQSQYRHAIGTNIYIWKHT